jgi:hypothetical protein
VRFNHLRMRQICRPKVYNYPKEAFSILFYVGYQLLFVINVFVLYYVITNVLNAVVGCDLYAYVRICRRVFFKSISCRTFIIICDKRFCLLLHHF